MYIPVLGGGSGDDFGRRIVEVSIIIIVEDARIEQFLLPNGNQDLISKAVLERVQESKLSSEVRSPVGSLQKRPSQYYLSKGRVGVLGKRYGTMFCCILFYDPCSGRK